MDINTMILLMWVAGFFQGLGLGIAFFPNLSTKGKIVSATLTFTALGLLISMIFVGHA